MSQPARDHARCVPEKAARNWAVIERFPFFCPAMTRLAAPDANRMVGAKEMGIVHRFDRENFPRRTAHIGVAVGIVLFHSIGAATAQQAPERDLAVEVQNPVAALISVPFQNNTYFGLGPNHNQTANVLNIQPVIPIRAGDWNLISRTIVPLIYLPHIGSNAGNLDGTITDNTSPKGLGETFGLGDINETLFVSPSNPGPLIWGVGPAVTIPTASSSILGSGKVSFGPSAVALVQPKPWTIGALFRQQWSIIGPNGRTDVNQSLLQPFVSYNLPDGWNLSTGPVITANWSVGQSQRWTVPVGGGFGKIFKIGKQPVSASLQADYNAERPDFAPRWSVRATLTLLFPE